MAEGLLERNIARKSAIRQAIDADINHDRPRTDPIAAHHLSLPGSGDQDFRPAAFGR
jgi:hypothetical protein